MMNAESQNPISVDPAFHASEAVDMASLGECCVGDINRYLDALVEISNVEGLPDKDLRKRCDAIKGLAEMAARFGENMESLMNCEKRDHQCALEALEASMKGGAR
jgi:hypothetical protein